MRPELPALAGASLSELRALARRLPLRVIADADGDPYLCKYLIAASPKGAPAADYYRLHLHRFLRSDHDAELHDHPWHWAVGWVLWGGYDEEFVAGERVVRRAVPPGATNLITAETFHRVELHAAECWTLFLSGPLHGRGWGFLDRAGDRIVGRYRPKDQFFQDKGLGPDVIRYLPPGDPRRGWLDD